MSGTRNANITLVEVTSDDSVGARKAAHVLAVAVLAALFAVSVASAAIGPAATPPPSGNVHTPGVQSEPGAPPALFAMPVASAATRPAATPPPSGNVHTPGVQSEPGAPPAPRGQALNRIYHLGSFARTSTLSPAKVKTKTKASTVLKPTAVKIAANPTGGSANKVQRVFSIH